MRDNHNCELTDDERYHTEKETRRESKACNLNTHQPSSLDEMIHKLIENCSTLTKIERSLAYCLRFIFNCRKSKEHRIVAGLTLTELERARREIIKYSQRTHFQEEIKGFQIKGRLNENSRLQLHAFLDQDHVLRVDGRLQEALWKFERKHPILLPAHCKVTHLIIEREHRTLLHAGPQLLLASIRQKYWPLNARNLVRQVCHSCIRCEK